MTAPDLRRVAPDRYVDFTPVGQGGMGTVYWALDTELSRQVAFKVIRAPGGGDARDVTPSAPLGHGSAGACEETAAAIDALRPRFLQEAWVTGGMEHPGIIPVYELGETDAGLPYYTMRFVRGSRTLASAIRACASAEVPERLDRLLEPFLKVCDTVRYAHSCGVIHRDLKPDNVALGEYGEVVVLDWGLARVVGGVDALEDPWSKRVHEARATEGWHTVASLLGTPGYMAPEAARGDVEAVDEQSDVYALGVMLFEILTGRLPFVFETTGEYQERVLEEAAPDPLELVPAAPEALAHLCQRALSREPSKRPESADAFADALRTWRTQAARDREVALLLAQAETALDATDTLRGAALLRELDRATAACRRVLDLDAAHPDASAHLARMESLRERGIQEREHRARRKTLRRAGAAALVVGAVAAVVVALLLEARRREAANARLAAEVSQARAEADRAHVEDVMGFMVFELQESLEPLGRLDVLAKVGTKARAYYASLPREGVSVESLLGHTVTLRRLGEVYEARGDLPAALEAYRLAANVAERIVAAAPEDAVGRYHRSLADAKIGMAILRQGYASNAKRALLEHRDDVRHLLDTDPHDPEYLDALASASAAIGYVLQTEGRWAEAESAYRKALDIARALETQAPDDPKWPRVRLRRQLEVARALATSGKTKEAASEIQDTLDEVRRRVDEQGLASDVRWSALEASSLFALAQIHDDRPAGREQRWDAALAAYRRLGTSDPDNDNWRVRIAHALGYLGIHHFFAGQPEKTPVLLAEAFDIGKALVEKDPSNASWRNLLITQCDRMARHQSQTGNEIRARHYRQLAVEQARQMRALDPANAKLSHILAFTLSHLARTWTEKHPERARALFSDAIASAEDPFAAQPASNELAVLLAESRLALGRLDVGAGRRADAIALWGRALDDLYACWALRPGATGLQPTARMVHGALVGELVQGGEEDRTEAQRRLRQAFDFIERWRSDTASGLSPDAIDALADWARMLARDLAPLASDVDHQR